MALSTASVYPESVEAAFQLAAELGYDGLELMVWTDPVSQDPAAVRRLVDRYGVAVLAVHAPCLLVTQRVWDPNPVIRLRRAAVAAEALGAGTVVVHPPFRWQRRYVRTFADEVAHAEDRSGVAIAVENMFPVRRAGVTTTPYAPDHDPTTTGHPRYTLDLSHTAAAGVDALDLMDRMGVEPGRGLTHVHLTDGSGGPRDEHLVPGRGSQPCAEVCERLLARGFAGTVVVEISTKRVRTRAERADRLAESLEFARLHLQPDEAPVTRPPAPPH
ncbi:MAG: Xylose isomerase protein barrel [Pseudonocardia sp.]|nr:Xylose isomerase protein barrel [Pseudonocardia sp.]